MEKACKDKENTEAGKTDRCVCCGACVPEGRMICWRCEHQIDKNTENR